MSPRKRPPWWNWSVSFDDHAELRMEGRGLAEIEARHILEHARRYWRSRIPGRWLVSFSLRRRRWILVVIPDVHRKVVLVVTVFPDEGGPR